eukprot:g4187.t1
MGNSKSKGGKGAIAGCVAAASEQLVADTARHTEVIAQQNRPEGLAISGVSLKFMKLFADEHGIKEGMTAADVCAKFVKPMTQRACVSVVALLQPDAHDGETAEWVGVPTHFLSYAWSYSFRRLLDIVENYEEGSPPAGGKTNYYFFDQFSLNQHKFVEDSIRGGHDSRPVPDAEPAPAATAAQLPRKDSQAEMQQQIVSALKAQMLASGHVLIGADGLLAWKEITYGAYKGCLDPVWREKWIGAVVMFGVLALNTVIATKLAFRGRLRTALYLGLAVAIVLNSLTHKWCSELDTYIPIGAWFLFVLVGTLYRVEWAGLARPGGRFAGMHFNPLFRPLKLEQGDMRMRSQVTRAINDLRSFTGLEATAAVWVVAWLAVVWINTFRRVNPYSPNAIRSAGQACGQLNCRLLGLIPIASMKNSIIAEVLGVSFERHITYHRQLAGFGIFNFFLHAALMVIGGIDNHTGHSHKTGALDLNVNGNVIPGIVALFFFGCTFVVTDFRIRRRFFEYFHLNHLMFNALALVASMLHSGPAMTPWILASLVFVCTDYAIRYQVKFRTEARVVALDLVGPDVVRFELARPPGLDLTPKCYQLNAGSFILLSFEGAGKGDEALWQMERHAVGRPAGFPPLLPALPTRFHFHPSNVTDVRERVVDGQKVQTYVVHLKNKEMVKHPTQWGGRVKSLARRRIDPSRLKVRIGGPHGRPTINPEHYGCLLMCAGGVGVTLHIGIMLDSAKRKHAAFLEGAGFPYLRRMILIWVVSDVATAAAFQREFEQIKAANKRTFGVRYEVKIFVTKSRQIKAAGETYDASKPAVPFVRRSSGQPPAEAGVRASMSSRWRRSKKVVPTADEPVANGTEAPESVGETSDDNSILEFSAEGGNEHEERDRIEQRWAMNKNGLPSALDPSFVTRYEGRPNFLEELRLATKGEMMARKQKIKGSESLGVFSCGPTGMMVSVRNAVQSLNKTDKDAPSLHLHEETYEW